ncbi:fatty acid synthase isoform X2 [Condylostylus longicornis]|uniref:fatty acid synthase isoform X2 n=1 Tax=Condylostylus longicornis TaxID=2530218 RepID=UPI00244E2481|nr:fatty acid synthase isoform X2 [Condylostylus longicornis]
MSPKPNENISSNEKTFSRIVAENDGEEIVISGMSGRFPNTRNIAEFEYNLFNKVDMVDDAETRWKHFNTEIPKRAGKLYDLEKFDANFFGINFKQAHAMDPQSRILTECVYEAILDAGVNPNDLRGSKTGVYIGACISESEKSWLYERVPRNGISLTGCSRSILAHRISYCFGLNGPSYIIDTACSSSMYALDNAFSALRSGEIDAAIVGGANLILHPYVTLQFARLGVLSKDGYCRPFDKDASGYTRSEAINCCFLQRKKNAKRIYATLIYSKTNCDGHKVEGITYPSGQIQEILLKDFYKDCQISPAKLGYLEAHSTGTFVGDPEECKAIDSVICSQRTEPLLVGSVKSNIGHSEASSGLCSVIKVLLSCEKGMVPPNINYTKYRPGITPLEEGRLIVVDKPRKFYSPYIGVNSFGFGGANAHALFKSNEKEKINNGIPDDNIPRLVVWAGRTEEAVHEIFNAIEGNYLDQEFIALINDIHKKPIDRLVYRGYGVFAKNQKGIAECLSKEIVYSPGLKRPVVFLFSGLSSEWNSMGAALLEISTFKETVEKSNMILKPLGVDIFKILTSSDSKIFDNTVNVCVGIATVQIGLVNILKVLDLEPDYYVGHSIGELACGYADGGITMEQAILAAYYRGKVCEEIEKANFKMVSIPLGYKKITKFLPENLDVACHNSLNSSFVCGPTEDVDKFVQILKENEVKEIKNLRINVPYHTRYVKHLGQALLTCMKKVIPQSVQRSPKWLSSSVPRDSWHEVENQFCSAEYFVNNFLNNVFFEELISMLPSNSILIEVSPRGLLQHILQDSVPNAKYIELYQKCESFSLKPFLESLGKLFLNKTSMSLNTIYPKVEWPVSRGTSRLCSLIKWDHKDDWFVTKFENIKVEQTGEHTFNINLKDDDNEYLSGHMIDGRILVPATAYLQYVWESFSSMYRGPVYMDMAVEFQDVKFLRATHLSKDTKVNLTVLIDYESGQFEVSDTGTTVVTGIIREILDPKPPKPLPKPKESLFPTVSSKDFYKELRLRGYHYNGGFRSVEEARGDGLAGKVRWNFNWVTFMDCLLQIHILGTDARSLVLPTKIHKLRIFGRHHIQLVNEMDPENQIFDVTMSRKFQRLVAGGIEIIGLHASPVARRKSPGIPVLEKYQFLPHFPSPKLDVADAVRICVQLSLENIPSFKMQIVELDNSNSSDYEPIISHFLNAIEDLPLISGDYTLLTNKDITIEGIKIEKGNLPERNDCTFVVATNLLESKERLAEAANILGERSYLVSREVISFDISAIQVPNDFELIGIFQTQTDSLVLLQSLSKKLSATPTILQISNTDKKFSWISEVQSAISKGPVILYCQNEKFNGLLGMVNCLRKEPECNSITCVIIDDPNAPPFNIDNSFYQRQLKKGMAINIYKYGQWGTYRHLQLKLHIVPKPSKDHIYTNVLNRGDLSSLNWFQGPYLEKNKVIDIQYASLNFRDVMLASGRLAAEIYGESRLEQQCLLGFEFCGTDVLTKKRIMGMTDKAACASFLTYKPRIMWEIPGSWSWAEAATVPCVYSTIYYAFFFSTQIEKGKSILIHAGTGGIGLAAIRTAFAYGLDVFTTVSTPQKKQFLLDTYPQLQESHIGNSRDTSFELMVLKETGGKGVDYVLNSLSEDKLLASVRCLAKGGHFLEIGKFDMVSDLKIGLGDFSRELTFHSVLADNLLTAEPDKILKIKAMVDRDLANGIIQPLPRHIFKANEIESAFRFLASAKHMGKVLIQIRDELSLDTTMSVKVVPQIYFNPNLVYIIPGGLGGFGLELADWLAIRGAKKIVLSSSRGISKTYQSYRIALWSTYNVETVIRTDDISTREGCENLIIAAMKLGKIGGVFNLAVRLKDSIFQNQTSENFIESMAPKGLATLYLDEITRKMCPDLEHFVVFSSVSCGRGNAGQTNYGMANSVMERIIEDRVANGFAGKAIQWGAVGEVGLVADMAENKIDMEIGGTLQQRISSCLQELDTLLSTPDALVASMVVAEKRIGRSGTESIMETVLSIMGIRDLKSVSMSSSLAEMGMDSLMAVEIKQTLERDFELILTPQDLRGLTFQKLQEYSDSRNKEGADNIKLNVSVNDQQLGMNLLVRNVGDTETCMETLIDMSTLVKAENLNKNPIIIIPGFESVCGNAWKELSKNLFSRAKVLQTFKMSNSKSADEIVDTVFEEVKMSLNKSKDFYIVGYSFGAVLAMEIAARLEKLGYTGQILILDGSPIQLKKLLIGFMGENHTDNDITDLVLTLVVNQAFPEERQDKIGLTFLHEKTYQDKIKKFSEYLQKQNKFTLEYSLQLISTLINRTTLISCGIEMKHVKSPITLVRPTSASVTDIVEDYEYSKYTSGKVIVKFVEGNHTSMLDNKIVTDIINEYDPNLH